MFSLGVIRVAVKDGVGSANLSRGYDLTYFKVFTLAYFYLIFSLSKGLITFSLPKVPLNYLFLRDIGEVVSNVVLLRIYCKFS